MAAHLAPAEVVRQMLQECQDSVDCISLEDLSSLGPEELVFLELPEPRKERRRYRCLARASIKQYAAASVQRLGLIDESGATGRIVVPTYLPGVDLEDRDLEFILRALERPASQGDPALLLHVASVSEAPARRILGAHETAVHVYELAEAQWERQLWAIFDEAVAPANTQCPAGHPLRAQQLSQDAMLSSTVICDRCERLLVGGGRHRCIRNCDFDLCEACFTRSSMADGKLLDRVARLKQDLETFWQEHRDFQLPPSPPLSSASSAAAGVRQLSTSVTKWNGFSLDAEDD
ncbi:unnamed protein product, partial [Polarella glacialis]